MKLKYAMVIAFMLLIPVANASLQKPNWGIGDYWEYRGSYSVKEETSFENMSVSIEVTTTSLYIKMQVEGVEIVNIHGEGYPCYKTKVIASSSGSISIKGNLGNKPVNYNGNFDLNGNGYIYFTTSSLSVAKNDMTLNVTTDISLPNMPSGSMNVVMEYMPPLDFMNFPVEKGEEWKASTNTTVYYGGISSTTPVSFSFKCIGKQGNTYIIKSGYNPFEGVIPLNNTLVFWDGSKGMIREIKDIGGSQSMDLKLVSYQYSNISNIPPTANFSYTPAQPKAGDNILFTSDATDSDGSIVSYFWEFGDGKNSTLANPSHIYTQPGKYTVRLTVMDNYGATYTKEITITVGGNGGGGNSGNSGNTNGKTPGFELIALVIAVIIILSRKYSIFK